MPSGRLGKEGAAGAGLGARDDWRELCALELREVWPGGKSGGGCVPRLSIWMPISPCGPECM